MNAVLFDLDGVLYEGDRPVEGAAEAVAWFQRTGIPHLFLTNTTSRPRSALVQKLAEHGIRIVESDILTPPVAARDWLSVHVSGKVALFVPAATQAEFAGLPILEDSAEDGAAALIIGDLGDGWTFDTMNRAFRLLMNEPTPALVALGMTRYWRAPGGLQLDVAPFVVALEHATGCRARVLGKPSQDFFEIALRSIGQPAAATIMVGDDIRGDIGAAQDGGIRGVLVQTGKFRAADLTQGIDPHGILDSVAALPEWWTNQGTATSPLNQE